MVSIYGCIGLILGILIVIVKAIKYKNNGNF